MTVPVSGGAPEPLASCRRILVLGSSGSGKSVFSRRLAGCLDLPVVHLDRLFWRPGFHPSPEAEWRELVEDLVREGSWIMDGTYERTLDLRIPAADALVYLESGRVPCLLRVARRQLADRGRERVDVPAGQRFDLPFIRYIWQFPSVTRPLVFRRIDELGSGKELVVLRGRRRVEGFLERIARARPRQPT